MKNGSQKRVDKMDTAKRQNPYNDLELYDDEESTSEERTRNEKEIKPINLKFYYKIPEKDMKMFGNDMISMIRVIAQAETRYEGIEWKCLTCGSIIKGKISCTKCKKIFNMEKIASGAWKLKQKQYRFTIKPNKKSILRIEAVDKFGLDGTPGLEICKATRLSLCTHGEKRVDRAPSRQSSASLPAGQVASAPWIEMGAWRKMGIYEKLTLRFNFSCTHLNLDKETWDLLSNEEKADFACRRKRWINVFKRHASKIDLKKLKFWRTRYRFKGKIMQLKSAGESKVQ